MDIDSLSVKTNQYFFVIYIKHIYLTKEIPGIRLQREREREEIKFEKAREFFPHAETSLTLGEVL